MFTRSLSRLLALNLAILGVILFMPVQSPAYAASAQPNVGSRTMIRIEINGEVAIATLENSVAARDFASMLPMEITLENYADIERIFYLPHKLDTTDAPSGMTPKRGDINYYAPWGNLAIFLGEAGYAHGLVKLGTIESGLSALERKAPYKVRIVRIDR